MFLSLSLGSKLPEGWLCAGMQKPETLTTIGQSDCINNNYLVIKDLTPALGGQFTPAKYGQGQWPFHLTN